MCIPCVFHVCVICVALSGNSPKVSRATYANDTDMEYTWNTYGIPMEYLWNTHGRPMEYTCPLHAVAIVMFRCSLRSFRFVVVAIVM